MSAFDPKRTSGGIYSITSFARSRNGSGIVKPSAVVRLITRSNLVGCSTGRSAGLAPCRILSTKAAARRNRSGKFDPKTRSKKRCASLNGARKDKNAVGRSRLTMALKRTVLAPAVALGKVVSRYCSSTAASKPTFPNLVSGLLAFAKEFYIRHNRLVGMVRPTMYDVCLVIGNTDHQACSACTPITACAYRLRGLVK